MKAILTTLTVATLSAGFASCAQPQRAPSPAQASRTGWRFESTGEVSLHPGQPCTSQIMFDFQPAKSRQLLWLAAPIRESQMLTDASKRRRRVHIAGIWQRGKTSGCSYVNVTRVEIQKSFLGF